MTTRATLDFSRHNEAAVRIYLQHWIIQQQQGFLIHPSVAIDKSDLKLMDIACGTGIWLQDVAQLLPGSARLDGSDISDAHFPPQHELPPNVTLRTLNILEPVSTDLHNQYDIVHIGRLNMAIRNEDPSAVLHNVYHMLKPGGFLQWDDLDVQDMYSVVPTPDTKTPYTDRLLQHSKAFFKHVGCGIQWIHELPSHFKKHGFDVTESKKIKISPAYAKPWNSMQLMGNRDYVEHDMIPATEGMSGMPTAEEWREIVDGVDEEVARDGVRIMMDIVYCVGKKE